MQGYNEEWKLWSVSKPITPAATWHYRVVWNQPRQEYFIQVTWKSLGYIHTWLISCRLFNLLNEVCRNPCTYCRNSLIQMYGRDIHSQKIMLHVNVRLGDVHTIKKCGIGCEFHAEVSAPSFIGLAFKKIVQNIHVKNSIKYKSIF